MQIEPLSFSSFNFLVKECKTFGKISQAIHSNLSQSLKVKTLENGQNTFNYSPKNERYLTQFVSWFSQIFFTPQQAFDSFVEDPKAALDHLSIIIIKLQTELEEIQSILTHLNKDELIKCCRKLKKIYFALASAKKTIEELKPLAQNQLLILNKLNQCGSRIHELSFQTLRKTAQKASEQIQFLEVDLPKTVEDFLIEVKNYTEYEKLTPSEINQKLASFVEICSLDDLINKKENHGASWSTVPKLFTTIKEEVKGKCKSLNEKINQFESMPVVYNSLQTISTEGLQFDSAASLLCTSALNLNNHFLFISDFLAENLVVHELSLDLCEHIFSSYAEPRNHSDLSKLPIAIQLVIQNNHYIQSQHTVGIIIKDDTIEYYDSQGVLSINHPLSKPNETIHDILLLCGKYFCNNESFTIIQNSTVHQFDSHSCGAFVAHFFYQRIVKEKPSNYLSDKMIPLEYLNFFRQGIAEYIMLQAKELEILLPTIFFKKAEDSEPSLLIEISNEEF